MKLFVIEQVHNRMRGGWTDAYIVQAEDKSSALAMIEDDHDITLYAHEIVEPVTLIFDGCFGHYVIEQIKKD